MRFSIVNRRLTLCRLKTLLDTWVLYHQQKGFIILNSFVSQLLVLSQQVPETILASVELPVKTAVVDQNGGGTVEEYRSKLISISYTESPNVEPLPLR
ncbi:hypothetical protein Cni_G22002 [Canna indica]|uniref:Uncharacterized protein n=1 Tax=Canna indica TaxID=4628 RepID=A0AAQ3KQM1_9LILI|nr:hypothetical protein Cni_G22002 [Canna indica]